VSQIFEALRTAQQSRAAENDRRRTRRACLLVPVFVYGRLPSRAPFHERACLRQVSDDGGLLTLSSGVQQGQKLLLINDLTQEAQKCFVVQVHSRNSDSVEVGVEFARPCPEFVQTHPRKP
jgi:hypothetical protein